MALYFKAERVNGDGIGQRWTVVIDGDTIPLQAQCFRFLLAMAEHKLATGGGQVFRGPEFGHKRYTQTIYQLRRQLGRHAGIIESMRLGQFARGYDLRLKCPEITFNLAALADHWDARVRAIGERLNGAMDRCEMTNS